MNKFIESILSKDYMTAEKEFHKEISERVNDTIESIKREISESLLESKAHKMEEMKDANNNGVCDDEEQLDEISKKTLGSYIKKADHEVYRAGRMAALSNRDKDEKGKTEAGEWISKRQKGISKAVDKLTESEQLDEISKKTLGSYIKKAGEDYAQTAMKAQQTRSARDRITHLSNTNDFSNDELKTVRKAQNDMYDTNSKKELEHIIHARKRQKGISKAVDKLTKD